MSIDIKPFRQADAVVKLSLLLREVTVTLSKESWNGEPTIENEIFNLQEQGLSVRYHERITYCFIVHVPQNYKIRLVANEICRYLTEDRHITIMKILEECASKSEQIVERF